VPPTNVHRTVPCVVVLALILAATSACATSGVSRRALAISDADRDAKRAIAGEAQIDPGKIPARAFTVLPFTVAERDTVLQPLSFAIADFLTSDLARSTELRMVERLRMGAILRELDLVDAGVSDPRTAPRVGRLIGARRLLIGGLSSAPNGDIVMNARVVDAIAGTVEQLVSASAPLSRMIGAEKALALRVFEELGITLTPAQRASVEQRQTTNLAASVAYGRGVEAEARGDAAGATAAYEQAVRLDATFAAAKTQAAASPPSSSQRSSGVQRVLDLSTTAINAPAPTKVAEAADAPIQSSLFSLLITIRVF
jgi:hypothetical protein